MLIRATSSKAASVFQGPSGDSLGLLEASGLHALAVAAEDDPMRCPDPEASGRMRAVVDRARAAGETLGGVFCVFATGLPEGLGSYVHWDRKLDGRLAQAILLHTQAGLQAAGRELDHQKARTTREATRQVTVAAEGLECDLAAVAAGAAALVEAGSASRVRITFDRHTRAFLKVEAIP